MPREEKIMSFNVDIIFKIAAIGIIVAVLNQVLIRAGREEQAMMTTLAGIIVVLVIIIQMVNDFFTAVKAMFQL
jgi:stage III sporulation protein AC